MAALLRPPKNYFRHLWTSLNLMKNVAKKLTKCHFMVKISHKKMKNWEKSSNLDIILPLLLHIKCIMFISYSPICANERIITHGMDRPH